MRFGRRKRPVTLPESVPLDELLHMPPRKGMVFHSSHSVQVGNITYLPVGLSPSSSKSGLVRAAEKATRAGRIRIVALGDVFVLPTFTHGEVRRQLQIVMHVDGYKFFKVVGFSTRGTPMLVHIPRYRVGAETFPAPAKETQSRPFSAKYITNLYSSITTPLLNTNSVALSIPEVLTDTHGRQYRVYDKHAANSGAVKWTGTMFPLERS